MSEDQPKTPDDLMDLLFSTALEAISDSRTQEGANMIFGVCPEGKGNITVAATRVKIFEGLVASFSAAAMPGGREKGGEVMRASLEMAEVIAAQVLTSFSLLTADEVESMWPRVKSLGLKDLSEEELPPEIKKEKDEIAESIRQFQEGFKGWENRKKEDLN
jgi:hypothetical protein